MLRVEYHDIGDTVTMRLEGRFVGEFAKDARDLVTRCKIPLRLVVNLSEVTFVDLMGEEVLLWLARIGGELLLRTVIPSTSANACTCRWRRRAPWPFPGRCNAFRRRFGTSPIS
jgi:anti-anti-sigma regulatory factor